MLRKQLTQIGAVIDNLETQLGAMADVASTVDVVGAMKQGSVQMTGMLAQIKETDVAAVLEEVDESMLSVENVMAAVSAPLRNGAAGTIDEDDMLAEMEGWQEQEADEQMAAVEQAEKRGRQQAAVPAAAAKAETGAPGNNRGGGGGALLEEAAGSK